MKLIIFFKLIYFFNYALGDGIESDDLKKKEPGFVFVHPKTLLAGNNETVCLTIYEAVLPTKVLIDLKIREKHHTSSHTIDSEYSCLEIQAPEHKSIEPISASLHIQIQLNGSIQSGHSQETILIYPKNDVTFIETDRSSYKLGDKVLIRILVLAHDLKPHDSYVIHEVKILNPLSTTVMVWEKLQTELGLLQLEFQLAEDTMMGKWKVETNGVSKIFQVKRYVLPRFKVTLNYPKLVYIKTENVSFSVCAKYSYGKLVKGVGLIKISYPDAVEESINRVAELVNGCTEFVLTNEELRIQSTELLYRSLNIVGTVAEKGTNKVEIDSGRTHIMTQPYELEFSYEKAYFQPGMPYKGKVKIVNALVPITDQHVEICYNVAVKKTWDLKQPQCRNFTFDSENSVNFYLLPVKANIVEMFLKAKSLNYSDEPAMHVNLRLNRWYSQINSYIHIERNNKNIAKCGSTLQFTIHYTSGNFKEHDNITFYYLVKSRNEILKVGKVIHNPRKQLLNYNELNNVIGSGGRYIQIETPIDKFLLKFKLDQNIISKSQLVVYYIVRNKIVAAYIDIYVEKCLFNQVTAKWSNSNLYPGELANLNIRTSPNSLCAVSSVDKSSTFMGTSKPLNVHTLLVPFLQERPTKLTNKPNCIPHHRQRPENLTESHDWDLRRRKRYVIYSEDFDTFEVFNRIGVGLISNFKSLTKPCPTRYYMLLSPPTRILAYENDDSDRGISIRSFFPETWLWELVPVGNQGGAVIDRYLPHSITNWVTNTMCISPTKGVGVSPTTELNVFKPFFIDILTPYSIKREEVLHLSVMIFNYMNHSLPIRVTLGDAPNLVLIDDTHERSLTLCVESEDSSTYTYRVKATALGRLNITVLAEIASTYPIECGPEVIINKRDVVYKTILVEPEGYPDEIVKTTLLCANESMNEKNVTWDIDLPPDIVADSTVGKILFNADLLGPIIQNLESFLAIPTGCGEQIMSTLAPNLYVLRYLQANNKSTPIIYQRALRNMKIGYQRILDYVHHDGSFSAFGFHDPAGSMFLTAFVIRTLQQAKNYIYIDENVIKKAVDWIIDHQLENGCFSAVSHVFQDMGGTSTENSTAALTAYVIISLLESNIELSQTVLTNAKYCIRGHHQPDKYSLAISTYALYLVEWNSEANRYLERLLEVATQEKSLMYWSSPGYSTAINIETTSYVLMSLLYKSTAENLIHASAVVRWLSTQRGPKGGFSTTQDTAVALDAISRYANIVKNKDPELNIIVSTNNQLHTLEIKKQERLKTKQVMLNDVPTNVKVNVEGDGCVLVQAVVTFSVKHLPHSKAFKLAVEVEPVSTIDQCSVATLSPCISYTGPGLHSNMAVLEVTMPSGYEPDRASLYQLTSQINTKAKKFEELKNRVILYFTQLNNEPICVPFNINENMIVENLINTTIKLYDYYKPELSVVKTYKVNTCQPNSIEPIPLLPESKNQSKVVNVSNKNSTQVDAPTENSTISTLELAIDNETITNIKKRDLAGSHLDNFIDLDIELATPDGLEGNIPTYVKPETVQYKYGDD